MVHTVLLVSLGFFIAALLAIAVAPAVWRRAGALKAEEIAASMPLSRNAMLADKDQQRAEFAIALRRVEIKQKSTQDKLSIQMAQAAIFQEKSRVLTKEREVLQGELAARSDQLEGLQSVLRARNKELSELNADRLQLENKLLVLGAEITQRDGVISNLVIDADNHRIELVAKMTEQDQTNARLRDANLKRKASEEKLQHNTQELRALQESVSKATMRVAELTRQVDRLTSQISDRDEKLERRENDLARLKAAAKINAEELSATKRGLSAANQRLAHLGGENSMKNLEDKNARMIAILDQLTAEKNDLLQKLLAVSGNNNSPKDSDESLRAQMHELTAKVVAFTAEQEGSASPIPRLLQNKRDANLTTALPVSLAERVKAAQGSG